MAAPKGNSFYKYVKLPTGKPKKYTPKKLWDMAVTYIEWAEKNPLYEMKVFSNGKSKNVPKMRAITENGFCLFNGIPISTWEQYKKNEGGSYKEFAEVISKICETLRQIKFEGASADLLNANIISRHLGLVDRVAQTTASGDDIQPMNLSNLTDDELRTLTELQRKSGTGKAEL